jgi:hypothetical protein
MSSHLMHLGAGVRCNVSYQSATYELKNHISYLAIDEQLGPNFTLAQFQIHLAFPLFLLIVGANRPCPVLASIWGGKLRVSVVFSPSRRN